jgi:hypothetical protein
MTKINTQVNDMAAVAVPEADCSKKKSPAFVWAGLWFFFSCLRT